MDVINYLKDIYGYATPIFLKDIRIGGKSKTAIRKELSRAVEQNRIFRRSQGVYYFRENDKLSLNLSFEQIIEKRFVKDDHGFPTLDLDVYGYYTGHTFLHMIGISQQVPAVIEVTTNKTSCKRYYQSGKFFALLRKGRIEINGSNYKALQFFDMISSFLTQEEVKKNKVLLTKYIELNLTKKDFVDYIGLYSGKVMKAIVEEGLINAFK